MIKQLNNLKFSTMIISKLFNYENKIVRKNRKNFKMNRNIIFYFHS